MSLCVSKFNEVLIKNILSAFVAKTQTNEKIKYNFKYSNNNFIICL